MCNTQLSITNGGLRSSKHNPIHVTTVDLLNPPSIILKHLSRLHPVLLAGLATPDTLPRKPQTHVLLQILAPQNVYAYEPESPASHSRSLCVPLGSTTALCSSSATGSTNGAFHRTPGSTQVAGEELPGLRSPGGLVAPFLSGVPTWVRELVHSFRILFKLHL